MSTQVKFVKGNIQGDNSTYNRLGTGNIEFDSVKKEILLDGIPYSKTSFTETDPTVPSWAKTASSPSIPGNPTTTTQTTGDNSTKIATTAFVLQELSNFDDEIFVPVSTLPTANIQTNKIYIVPNSLAAPKNNLYDEYIYKNNAWELIGTSLIDLNSKEDKWIVIDVSDPNNVTLPTGFTPNYNVVLVENSTTNLEGHTNSEIAFYYYSNRVDKSVMGRPNLAYTWVNLNTLDSINYINGNWSKTEHSTDTYLSSNYEKSSASYPEPQTNDSLETAISKLHAYADLVDARISDIKYEVTISYDGDFLSNSYYEKILLYASGQDLSDLSNLIAELDTNDGAKTTGMLTRNAIYILNTVNSDLDAEGISPLINNGDVIVGNNPTKNRVNIINELSDKLDKQLIVNVLGTSNSYHTLTSFASVYTAYTEGRNVIFRLDSNGTILPMTGVSGDSTSGLIMGSIAHPNGNIVLMFSSNESITVNTINTVNPTLKTINNESLVGSGNLLLVNYNDRNVLDTSATNPLNPVTGASYFNTTYNKLLIYNGTTWVDVMGNDPTATNYVYTLNS